MKYFKILPFVVSAIVFVSASVAFADKWAYYNEPIMLNFSSANVSSCNAISRPQNAGYPLYETASYLNNSPGVQEFSYTATVSGLFLVDCTGTNGEPVTASTYLNVCPDNGSRWNADRTACVIVPPEAPASISGSCMVPV